MSVALLAGALIINTVNFITLALYLKPVEGEVPIRYSSLGAGFSELGPWYYPFLMALFAVLITLVNAIYAYQSFNRSRLASFFLLAGSGVVAIFTFIISMAFGAIR
jgi:hypothetical protein